MDLLVEYELTLKNTKDLLECAPDEDKKVIKEMISDIEYAIEWLSTGRRPGNKRGIERRAAYQRERPFDPLIIQRFFRSTENIYYWDDEEREPEDAIGPWDKIRIEDALSDLTDLEKEIYLMSRGNSLSYSQISNYFDVSRSAVQGAVERAEKKISKRLNTSLFCLS